MATIKMKNLRKKNGFYTEVSTACHWGGGGHKKQSPPQQIRYGGLLRKTAATYSPTVTQYHRRDRA